MLSSSTSRVIAVRGRPGPRPVWVFRCGRTVPMPGVGEVAVGAAEDDGAVLEQELADLLERDGPGVGVQR